MKSNWHEQIQRHLDGQSNPEEAATLRAALNEDAELRALYLDYTNLDMALGAAAEAATIPGNGISRIVPIPQPSDWSLSRHWRWIAATAAGAALVAFIWLPRQNDASRSRADVAITIASAQHAIDRLSYKPAATLPAWMSPTAAMLDQPRFPQ